MTTTQNTIEAIKAQARAILDGHSTDELIEMLTVTNAQVQASERGSDAWKNVHSVWLMIAETLEARYDVDALMDAWAMADTDSDYTGALIASVFQARHLAG